jgi:hypothetical protein
MPAAGAFALTTAHRMINRVHCHTADMRSFPLPPASSSLSEFLALVLPITYLAYARAAIAIEFSHLSRGQPDEDVPPFLGHELSTDPSTSDELRALPDLHFNIVDYGAQWNVNQRQTVTRLNIYIVSGNDRITYRDSIRRQDVSLLSIDIT